MSINPEGASGGLALVLALGSWFSSPKKWGGDLGSGESGGCSFGRKEKTSTCPETAGDLRQARGNYRREKLIGNNSN